MEQRCGRLAVENIPKKNAISAHIFPRSRAQSGACAEVQFPDNGTVL
jgi:hypothetical protein